MKFLPHLRSPEWSGPAHLSRALSALLPSTLLQHFPICPTRNFTNILSQNTSPALSDSLLLTLTSPFKWRVLAEPSYMQFPCLILHQLLCCSLCRLSPLEFYIYRYVLWAMFVPSTELEVHENRYLHCHLYPAFHPCAKHRDGSIFLVQL